MKRENRQYSANDQTDPYGDDTKASFYRLPVVVRKTKKINKEVNIETINSTTRSLGEFKYPETPQKYINSRVGEKVLKTNNQFQQDLFFNEENTQKKLLTEQDNIINLNDKIYVKNLQQIWPCQIKPNQHSHDEINSSQLIKSGIVKGHNRWTQLPNKQQKDLMIAESISETENLERQNSRKRDRNHSSLNLLVDQWRKKWQLTQKYADSTVDELLQDMVDVHPTIRLQAIVTAAKAASIIHDQKYGQTDTTQETIKSDCLPPVLINAIEILLDDSHFQVRKAAAIALHSLEKATVKSMDILKELLISESNVDRWAAVQCLALSNNCDSFVIGELIDQLMNSEDILVHEKASHLLAKVSCQTKLVHGMLGEKLNSISWRQRLIICKTIPLLHGYLNRDLLRKIIYLMWHDPDKHVKIAASQVLGKTGNGKAVHDELIAKLQSDSELIRADALEKIGILKVMTTRIMPAFLKCFKDEFVLVRKEICRACYYLKIQDTICVGNLLQLARYDPLWKVKYFAIKALSKVKTSMLEIRSCFLWALQFESKVELRLVALQAISTLNSLDNEIVEIIKSRFLVESDESLLRILRKILNHVNINPSLDINTVAEIKEEVRKFFSDKNHIIDVILHNEAVQDYNFLKEILIAPNKSFKESSEKFEEIDESLEVSESESESESDHDSINTLAKEIEVVERFNSDLDNLALSPIKNQIDETPIVTDENDSFENINENLFVSNNIIRSPTEKNNLPQEEDELLPEEDRNSNKELAVSSADISIIKNIGVEEELLEYNNCANDEILLGKSVEVGIIVDDVIQKIDGFSCESTVNLLLNDDPENNMTSGIENEREENTKISENNIIISNNKEIENVSPYIKWRFILPNDTNHIRIIDHDNSMIKPIENLFGEIKIDLLESMINPNIRKLVDEAIQDEGLDCQNI